jgi:hypothetical protein
MESGRVVVMADVAVDRGRKALALLDERNVVRRRQQ